MRFRSGVCVCVCVCLVTITITNCSYYVLRVFEIASVLSQKHSRSLQLADTGQNRDETKDDQLFRFSSHFSIIFNRLTVKCRFVA